MTQVSTLEQRALKLGADLVLEGGGVKGIGLAGAVITLSEAGYVFPRIGGTSAGAIVAALVAAYQTKSVPLTQLGTDMQELDYTRFMDKSFAEQHFGVLGLVKELVSRQGLYSTGYLDQWLHSKLDPIGVHTFADLKIDDDPGTGLPPQQRYRLVVHTSDLTRQCLARLPWDLPAYKLPEGQAAPVAQQIAAIDAYPVVDAVRASMSIPFFFQPFRQLTPEGSCTWVDGGMLQTSRSRVDTMHVSATDFTIDQGTQNTLYANGCAAATAFLAAWNAAKPPTPPDGAGTPHTGPAADDPSGMS
jgi:NTE family protein